MALAQFKEEVNEKFAALNGSVEAIKEEQQVLRMEFRALKEHLQKVDMRMEEMQNALTQLIKGKSEEAKRPPKADSDAVHQEDLTGDNGSSVGEYH